METQRPHIDEALREAIDAASVRHGIACLHVPYGSGEPDPDGPLTITSTFHGWDTVRLCRTPHPSESRSHVFRDLTYPTVNPVWLGKLPKRILDHIDALLAEYVRLSRREAAMRDPYEPPAWTFRCDRTLVTILGTIGVDPAHVVHLHSVVRMEGRRHGDLAGFSGPGYHAGEGRRYGDLVTRVFTDGTIRICCDERPHVAVPRMKLPETVRLATVGTPINEVIGHPLLEAVTAKVKRIVPKRTGLRFELEPDEVDLAEAPEGVDTGWRRR